MSEYLDGIEGYDDVSIDEPVAQSFNAAQYAANARPNFYKYPTWYLNPAHIEKAIKAIVSDGDVFEIRLFSSKYTASGYFKDSHTAVDALTKYKASSNHYQKQANETSIYILLNPAKNECFAREQHDKLVEKCAKTTTDKEIARRKWLFIDLDPVRLSGISSTDAELESAFTLCENVKAYMRDVGFTEPMQAISGNGCHLLYHIDLPNDEESKKLVEQVLKSLATLFDNDDVKIDTANFNAARICKLYGTVAKKGANDTTSGRVHRPALMLNDGAGDANGRDLLEKLVERITAELPHENDEPTPPADNSPKKAKSSKSKKQKAQADGDRIASIAFVDNFATQFNIPVKSRESKDGTELFVLESCVFDPSHTGKDAAILVKPDGKICYHCFHDSCQDKSWRDVRLKYEPDAYDKDRRGTLDIEWDGETLSEVNVKKYLKAKGYTLAYCAVTHRVSYSGITDIHPEHLDNDFALTCYDALSPELNGVKSPKLCGQYIYMIAHKNEYNPVLNAIHGTTWDGRDHLTDLYNIMGLDDGDTLSKSFVRKWMMQGYCLQFNTLPEPIRPEMILVLFGAQGVGKTWLLEKLAINPYLYKEGHTLNVDNKDSVMQATSVFLCELGELGKTTKKDVDGLKAFFTLPFDEYRVPYGAVSERHPRRTIFAGSVNDEQFLKDRTGNRRYAVIPLDSLNTNAVKALSRADVLQMWAQIAAIVNDEIANGNTLAACFRLTAEEREQQEHRNSRYVIPLTAEEEVTELIQKAQMQPELYNFKLMTVTEWQEHYAILRRYSVNSISRALKAAGLDKIITRKIDGKTVKLRNLPVLAADSAVMSDVLDETPA